MNIKIESQNFGSQLHGGQYAATSDLATFPAWCAERTQYLYLGESIAYDVVDSVTAWGEQISGELDRMMSWSVGHGWPTSIVNNDLIQVSIWDILGGGQGQIDTSGSDVTQHALLLHNSSRQDLLFLVPIDEPEPLLLVAFGLALMSIAIAGKIHQ